MRSRARAVQEAPVTQVTGASWRPLLSGTRRDRALETARTLAADVEASGSPAISLSAGAAGWAVCHAALARATDDDEAARRARAALDRAVEGLGSERMPPSLFAGFAGIAWAAEVVDRLLDEGGQDRNEAIDDALALLLRRPPDDGMPYDLIQGLTGIGVYALERWPAPGAARCLAGVAAQLSARARSDDDGAYWWTAPSVLLGRRRELFPDGGVDLGMAHGMAAVLPLLARTAALGIAQETLHPLLDDAVGWLTARLVQGPAGPTAPAFLAAGTDPGPARSAWCYGDPGVAAALLLASRDARRPAWADTGLALARSAAARPPEQTGVQDAGLCHGAAGLAHLFNRMHQLTGAPELADAALLWLDRTLDMCADVDAAGAPWSDAGLLEGTAGIALALLAAATSTEPLWDRMLLVSTGAAPDQGAPG